jgi:hypothetical protein
MLERGSPAYLDTVAKAQYVRLIDIFVLGPALLYTAAILPRDRPLLRAFMVVAGAGTVYYNARNYMDIQQLAAGDERLARDAWVRLP